MGQHDDVAAESRIADSAVSAPSSVLSSIFEIVSNTLSLSLRIAFNSALAALLFPRKLCLLTRMRDVALSCQTFLAVPAYFCGRAVPSGTSGRASIVLWFGNCYFPDYVSQSVREIVC